MNETTSPLARNVLHPFKVGLGISARYGLIFLKLAALIGGIVLIVFAIYGTIWGSVWLVKWSLLTVIPLSIPPLLLLIWLIGVVTLSIRNAAEQNIRNYESEIPGTRRAH